MKSVNVDIRELSPIYRFIYIYIGKPGVDLHGNQPFSDIFFDKFKNLLDDYIVNYQVKYFFYTLFISFFYLELSECFFQFLHNYSPYHLSLFGSFLIDFCYSLFNLSIIDFFYSYFAFNLNAIGYGILLISDFSLFFSTIVMAAIICTFSKIYENRKHELNLRIVAFMYFLYSFFFFVLFQLNLCSLGSFIFFTLLCFTISKINVSTAKEVNMYFLLFVLSLIFLPYYIIFSLFLVIFYLSMSYEYALFEGKPLFKLENFDIDFFGDLLLLFMISFFVYRLEYVNSSLFFFVLHTLPMMSYVLYLYADEEEDCSNRSQTD